MSKFLFLLVLLAPIQSMAQCPIECGCSSAQTCNLSLPQCRSCGSESETQPGPPILHDDPSPFAPQAHPDPGAAGGGLPPTWICGAQLHGLSTLGEGARDEGGIKFLSPKKRPHLTLAACYACADATFASDPNKILDAQDCCDDPKECKVNVSNQ